MNKEKVLVGMSGGVDSSITVLLLQELGYKVSGMRFRNFVNEAISNTESDVNNFANTLKIPFYIIDVQEDFKSIVVSNFIEEYFFGRTPNPCVICNPLIKWKYLIRLADENNCKYVATGHYARINFTDGRYYISKGVDETKDQSYFLWKLSQEYLSRTIFPLGNYSKNEVKNIAINKGLEKIAKLKESVEICFIPDNDYRNFLKNTGSYSKLHKGEGNFINTSGEILGRHNGLCNYTVGQRKGTGISVGHPLYVTKIRQEDNTIVLGEKKDFVKSEMWIKDYNLMKYDNVPDNKEVITKIRYKNIGIKSKISMINNRIKVNFFENIAGIAPGQSAVFYEGDDVIGGGIIE